MGVEANLKIKLLANNIEVAESEDEQLWRKVLGAIRGTGSELGREETPTAPEGEDEADTDNQPPELVAEFADLLGVDVPTLQAACHPSTNEPYLRLDMDCWEALKENMPSRGPASVSGIVSPATLLALWCKSADLDLPTVSAASAILRQVSTEDKNLHRAIKRCKWLQLRPNGSFYVDPGKLIEAKAFARAFCLKQAIKKK